MSQTQKYRVEQPNFDPSLDYENSKRNITMKRYSYFDFDLASLKAVAESDIESLKWKDAAMIVQCLYPRFLVCSGLFDSFLLFDVFAGERVDPPFASWRSLFYRQNESENTPFLIESFIELFEKNGIKPHESWNAYLDKVRVKSEKPKGEKR